MSAGPLVRSTVYALLQLLITLPYALLSVLTFPLPALTHYRFVTRWTSIMLRLAERVLGIRPRVLGRENIPPGPGAWSSASTSRRGRRWPCRRSFRPRSGSSSASCCGSPSSAGGSRCSRRSPSTAAPG